MKKREIYKELSDRMDSVAEFCSRVKGEVAEATKKIDELEQQEFGKREDIWTAINKISSRLSSVEAWMRQQIYTSEWKPPTEEPEAKPWIELDNVTQSSGDPVARNVR